VRYSIRPLTPAARARTGGKGTEISPFRASWSQTEQLLDRELRLLRATTVILLIDVNEPDIRLDGKLRATARPLSSACAIQFDSRTKGSLLIGCGRFRHWQDNVRAIALGLEALRKVERYGIVQANEQYEGWRALPEGGTTDVTDIDRAWKVIALLADVDETEARLDGRYAYRLALKRAHPDHGGAAAAFRALQEAAKLLGLTG
jgi:hypothetical protein